MTGRTRRARIGRSGVVAALLVGMAAMVGTTATTAAHAEAETVWARSKNPEAERRRELIGEAENLERKARHLMGRARRDTFLAKTQLARAAILLHEAGAETSADLFLRYRLATIYELEESPELALPLLEGILRASPPPPLRASTYARLGIVYAQLGRVKDEIAAYTGALEVQPIASERATLLSNRAEALMRSGDVTRAVAGYRGALALLSADWMVLGNGSTILWGLGVALDRSGDLDSALDAIRVARIYDARDKNLEPEAGWFYSPAYDHSWYEALGAWQVARKAEVLTSVRVDAYARTVAAWTEFISSATPEDKWLSLARLRLKQCESERAGFMKGLAHRAPSKPSNRAGAPLRDGSDDSLLSK